MPRLDLIDEKQRLKTLKDALHEFSAPAAGALTFGMLGCDFHCGYCFTPDTTVITDAGPVRFGELFDSAARTVPQPDGGAIAFLNEPGRRTIAASGEWRQIEAVFRHPYRGPLVVLKPMYLPPTRCTPDHGVYATSDPAQPPVKVKAGRLTPEHFLAVP